MSEAFTQADALRLRRVVRALAAAGLIDEWHVFLQGIDGRTAETRVVAMTLRTGTQRSRWIAAAARGRAHARVKPHAVVEAARQEERRDGRR
jgi:hypothetical protein